MSTPASTAAMAVGAACLAGVALLTLAAVVANGPTSLDQTLSTWVAQQRSPGAVSLMEVVTVAGSAVAIWLVGVGCLIWGFARDAWRPIRFVIPTALAASLITNLMKLVIARPRPTDDIALRHFSGYSFPSGHATTAAALWGALAVALVWSGHVRVRSAVAGWTTFVVLVSASRIILGAHWLTDVIAGTAVGTACVAVAVLIAGPTENAEWRQHDPLESDASETQAQRRSVAAARGAAQPTETRRLR